MTKVRFSVTYRHLGDGEHWCAKVRHGAQGVQVWFVKRPSRKQVSRIIKWIKQAEWGMTYPHRRGTCN